MKNRIISACLACLMLLSLLPMAAFAAPIYVNDHEDLMQKNALYDNLPTADYEKDEVTFKNGWEVGYFDIAKDLFAPFSHVADARYKIIGAEGVSYIWTNGGGMYKDGCMGLQRDAAATKPYTIRYTAQASGELEYTIDLFNFWWSGGTERDVNTFDLALYHNGVKIWPADANWFRYEDETNREVTAHSVLDGFLAAVTDFPMSISVNAGDKIDLRIGCVDHNMLQMGPAVKYTALLDAPEVEGLEIDFDKDMDCYIGVYLDRENSREGAKVGANYWLSDADNFDLDSATPLTLVSTDGDYSVFSYDGFTIKQMTDKIWVQAYTTVDGSDKIHYANVTEMSIAAAMEEAYNDETDEDVKEILRAFVNLGANAQYAFGYNDSDLANAFLDAALQSPSENFGNDVWAQNANGTTGVKITLASLVLDNQIGMKFVAPKVAGVSEYKLQVSKNADFSDAVTVDMTATEDDLGYRGVYYVNFNEMSDTFYIRVASGSAYGDTLTYSVESYVSRISMEPIRDDEYLLAAAIYDFIAAIAE